MKSIITIIKRSDSIFTELLLYIISMFWGGWILLPKASFYMSSIFKPLSAIASEPFWGAASVVGGLLGLYALSQHIKGLKLRKYLTFVGSLYWMFISTFSFINTPFYASFPMYMSVSVLFLICFLKLPRTKRLRGGRNF